MEKEPSRVKSWNGMLNLVISNLGVLKPIFIINNLILRNQCVVMIHEFRVLKITYRFSFFKA